MNSRIGITPRGAAYRANAGVNTTTPTTPPPAPARAPILRSGALLVVALAAVSANRLGAPFVYDDGPAIADNPTIRRLWSLAEVPRPQAEGGLTVRGRPVLHLSFTLNYAVSGTAVWSCMR